MMSPEEMQEGQRLLSVLDKQLAMLKSRHAKQFRRFDQTPSQNAWFTYVSDVNGVIKVDSDATFVVERLFLYAFTDNDNDPRSPVTPDLILRDQSAGRSTTQSHGVSFAVANELAGNVQPTVSVFSESDYSSPLVTIPLLPGSGVVTALRVEGLANTDFQRCLPVEFEIPRGGSVSVQMRTQFAINLTVYPFAMSGYKVY